MDLLQCRVLKNMPPITFNILAKLFNFCLSKGYFPKIFKKAKVVPVLKKGKNPKLPNSYRPISMLSILDKLFEKVIKHRLLSHAGLHNIINKEQFGFRKEHSTVHQIKRVMNFIENNKLNRKSTGVVFLDIEKGFDTVWHDGLVFKLNKFGFPLYLQKIIKHYFFDRSFVVCIDNTWSTPRKIPARLPEGSVLSPTLYSIYTSDITIKKSNEAAFYADDSALICSGKLSNAIIKRLNDSLICAAKYFSKI